MNDLAPLQINRFDVPTNLPVFWCSIAHHVEALKLAREAIDDVRITHPDSTPSNVQAVYMSPWKSHRLTDKFQPLIQIAINAAKEAGKQHLNTDITALNLDYFATDCWGVIYENSDHTIPHTHFPSDFAVVAYLEANENCAPIIFENTIQVQPVPGSMVVFPGIMNHHVPQNNDKRVIVAMNLQKFPSFLVSNDNPPG
ncbi:MAG: hypothetical protein ACO278_09270 [Limnohabitans sp.]|jgi:hypothetical protein